MNVCIGVDTLIGFPGETESAFENTYQLIAQLPVAYLHVFPYSPRKGTPASEYDNQVPSKVIKERTAAIRALGRQKRSAFYRQNINIEATALIEARRESSSDRLKGLTDNYIPVLLEGPDSLMNTLQTIRIESVDKDNRVFGRIVG